MLMLQEAEGERAEADQNLIELLRQLGLLE